MSLDIKPEPFERFLSGGGEMGRLIRSLDWSSTPLGPIDSWPQSLRSAVSILLPSKAQIALFWGPELITLYNDAYRPVFGGKHPHALGQPIREAWSELWGAGLRELFENVLTTGEAFWARDRPFYMERHGFPEETFFDVSYDPVRDESGRVGGVFCIVSEQTARVIGERRLQVLRDLGAVAAKAHSASEAWALSAGVLATAPLDVPFVDADLEDRAGWPLGLQDVAAIKHCMATAGGPWPEPASAVMVLPLGGHLGESGGKIALGVSSRLAFDDRYRDFFELVARQVAASVAAARAAEEERRRAEALAELDRAKTAFFSNVSHEFRTPLTLILGPLEDTLSNADLPAPDRHRLDVVHRNSLRLLKLVNSLLDFSRIEAGRAQATYEPVDAAAFTAELASNFRSACDRAGLQLVVDCKPLSQPVYIDRDMWEKLVLNLLSNAFKYTFEGEIIVRLRETDDRAELTVADSGVGIPEHELPRVFERFHRIEGQRSRTHEGSGIGLALVQELVKLHGGSIQVASQIDRGTAFTISIPFGTEHLPQDRIGAERRLASTSVSAEAYVQEALRWLPDGAADSEHAFDDGVRHEPFASPKGERASILVADDNADMREYVCRLLAGRYRVEAVADGEVALESVMRTRPDLVVADVMMPRLDGLGLLARLRGDPATATLPVVLLSARAGEESRVEGLAAGADDYLVKPFSGRELLARIDAHLQLERARRNAQAMLRESEARFRHMADHAPVMIWVTEPDGSCTFLSRSWYDFTGQTPETGLGHGWLEAVHPDDRASTRNVFQHANAAQQPFRLEYRLRRKDGEYRWAIDAAAPRLSESGAFLGYVGSVIDISERKRAEETQRLLIDELQHRVKNTLANVQAIVRHTLRNTNSPEQFAASLSGRIQSLSRVHSLLSNTQWQGADLRHVISDQLSSGPADEGRVAVWGPGVQLSPQLALHLALMLHELGTNSAKYGALSRSDGRVSISWKLTDEQLQLHWSEYGGPPVKAPSRRGFGMTLIEQSAQGQGGSASMIVQAEGIAWNIKLPIRHPSISNSAATGGSRGSLQEMSVLMHDRTQPLAGKRLLVVEDEPLVGLDIVASLEGAGAIVHGPVGKVEDALRVIESAAFDGALLDANLHGKPVDEIAAALTRRQLPFAFVTGYGRASLPHTFGTAPLLAKPYTPDQLIEMASSLVSALSGARRLRE